jgi:hypothetical protein
MQVHRLRALKRAVTKQESVGDHSAPAWSLRRAIRNEQRP